MSTWILGLEMRSSQTQVVLFCNALLYSSTLTLGWAWVPAFLVAQGWVPRGVPECVIIIIGTLCGSWYLESLCAQQLTEPDQIIILSSGITDTPVRVLTWNCLFATKCESFARFLKPLKSSVSSSVKIRLLFFYTTNLFFRLGLWGVLTEFHCSWYKIQI